MLHGSHCVGRVRRELPVARVRGREQLEVLLRERLAPVWETGVDRSVRNACGSKRTADVGRSGVTRDVGAVGVRSENGVEGEPARLDVDLVVRQKQRSVDVEENEPGQLVTTESTASRNVQTYSLNASGPPSATSTAREPTTIPSASPAAARASSGVEMPKPA